MPPQNKILADRTNIGIALRSSSTLDPKKLLQDLGDRRDVKSSQLPVDK